MKTTDRQGNEFPEKTPPGIAGSQESRSREKTLHPTGNPRIISWNVTLKCPLNCSHCYADAGEDEVPGVLSTKEAFGVIDQICETGNPVVVLSGGEPLMRDDIFAIARYGTDHGLRMALGTSGYLLSRNTAAMLKDAGIRSVAVSIDSANPDIHDRFRGCPGAWGRAVRALRWCREAGIGTRINMTIQDYDIALVDDVVNLGTGLGVNDYQVFFPVPTGRAHAGTGGTPSEYERLIGEILARYRSGPVHIRPTCAPQFVRIADQLGIRDDTRGRGCIAGIHYCRIYANGDVTPCPYLPVTAGNVRDTPFFRIWHESEVFAALRDPDGLTGKCGRCGYKGACGGCRARAYGIADAARDMCGGLVRPAHSAGEYCGQDPSCIYEPEAGVP